MKKVTAILLVVIYSSLSVISAVNIHYCHGKMVDFSLNTPAESCCGTEDAVSSPCCKDVSVDIDLEDYKRVQGSLKIESVKSILLILFSLEDYKATYCSKLEYTDYVICSPPGATTENIFLLKKSLLFYG